MALGIGLIIIGVSMLIPIMFEHSGGKLTGVLLSVAGIIMFLFSAWCIGNIAIFLWYILCG